MPQLAGPDSVTLAVGIIGATVMPHAIYLHSSLTQDRVPARTDAERRRILGYSNREVLIALGVAGLVNMAMLAMAAAVFQQGHAEVAAIETAYHTLVPLLGVGAGRGVHGVAARVRHVEFGGRHDGRPDDHAGLRRLPHSAMGATRRHDGPGRDRRGDRRQFDRRRWC